jgi:hypothetical protein
MVLVLLVSDTNPEFFHRLVVDSYVCLLQTIEPVRKDRGGGKGWG